MSINIYQKLVKNVSIQLTCWYKLKKNCTQETFNTFEHCWIYWFKLKKKHVNLNPILNTVDILIFLKNGHIQII